MRITGNSFLQRKKCLALLVVEHLTGLGEDAEIIVFEKNSEGYRDQVVVKSSLGVIHVIATASKDPNEKILIANYNDHNQNFLAGKDFVVFGWNTRDKRTMLIFVKAIDLLGLISLSKSQIVKLKIKKYSVAITA